MSIQPTTNPNTANFLPPLQQPGYPQQAAQGVSQTTNQLSPQSSQPPNFLLTASRIQAARQQAPTSQVLGYTGSVSRSSLPPLQSSRLTPSLASSQVLTSQVPSYTGSVSRSSLPPLQSSRLTPSLASSQVLTSQVPSYTGSVSQATNQLSQSNTFPSPSLTSSYLQAPGQLQESFFDSQTSTQRTVGSISTLPPLFADFNPPAPIPTVTTTQPHSPRHIEESKNAAKVEKWAKRLRLMKQAVDMLQQEEQIRALGNAPEAITVETLLEQLQDPTLSKELLSLRDVDAYKIETLKEKFGYQFFYTVQVSNIKNLIQEGYSVVLLQNTYANDDINSTYPMTSKRLKHESIDENREEVHFITQVNSEPHVVAFEPLLIKNEVVIVDGAKDGLLLKQCATNTIRLYPQEGFPYLISKPFVQVVPTTTTTTIQQTQPVQTFVQEPTRYTTTRAPTLEDALRDARAGFLPAIEGDFDFYSGEQSSDTGSF